jgi:alkanesulfonate monooxygenase SsuD/methylene tetrahydromethanopterin reductase-like flavin-dependent oxidoreductase (luciferase family)
MSFDPHSADPSSADPSSADPSSADPSSADPSSAELYLAVALDGAGWHPAAWRAPEARPAELFSAHYWADLVHEAERGFVDFVTFEDALSMQSSSPAGHDERTDQVRGRLDAVLLASRVAPGTSRIGLVPTVIMAHTEPFHISKAIATLDHVTKGRAGVQVKAGNSPAEAAHFGRRPAPGPCSQGGEGEEVPKTASDLLEETADYIEVVRRLWDSWEDGAEIRDAATGRFIDRQKLHYIDFQGDRFNVRGPSITPRPPQGQPLVSVLAHDVAAYRLAGRVADIVYVTPRDEGDVTLIGGSLRAAQAAAGRPHDALLVFADLVVFLDGEGAQAGGRKQRLDVLDGAELNSDAHVFVGTAEELAELFVRWRDSGVDGFRLRPGTLPHDLVQVTQALVPALQRRGVFRREHRAFTLREALGQPRPGNRYAPAAVGARWIMARS